MYACCLVSSCFILYHLVSSCIDISCANTPYAILDPSKSVRTNSAPEILLGKKTQSHEHCNLKDSEDLIHYIVKRTAARTKLASKAGPHDYFKLLNRRQGVRHYFVWPRKIESWTNPSSQITTPCSKIPNTCRLKSHSMERWWRKMDASRTVDRKNTVRDTHHWPPTKDPTGSMHEEGNTCMYIMSSITFGEVSWRGRKEGAWKKLCYMSGDFRRTVEILFNDFCKYMLLLG